MGWESKINIFNIIGVQWRIWLLGRGGSHTKTKNREDCFKRGLGQLADLIGGLAKEWCFWGGWYPNSHYGYKKQEPKY